MFDKETKDQLGDVYIVNIFNLMKRKMDMVRSNEQFGRSELDTLLVDVTGKILAQSIKHNKIEIDELEKYLYEKVSQAICDMRNLIYKEIGKINDYKRF